MSEEIIFTIWTALGIASHVYWWNRLTRGEWDGPAIPLFLLTLFQAALLGPIIFVIEGLLWSVTEGKNS